MPNRFVDKTFCIISILSHIIVYMSKVSDISKDSLFNGRLICHQNKKGYRFSIDSVLLAHFSSHLENASILDMGCGCAILGLILLYRNNNILTIDGIEIQESLVKLAKMNCSANNFENKLTIHKGDYRQINKYFPAENFTNIICNPPFYKIGRGRQSKNEEAHVARHQIAASVADIVNCIAYSLKNRGCASLIYPADSLVELISQLEKKNIQPKRIRAVYSYPASKTAKLVLVEGVKNGGEGLQILEPLYIYNEKNGLYSSEVNEMYLP